VRLLSEAHTVKEFVDLAAEALSIKLEWRGVGDDEHAVLKGTNKVVVRIDPLYFPPTDVQSLLGDARKIRSKLNWTPKTSFNEMVNEMAKSDYDLQSQKQK
jgi:GDPmannose 4,6-dehydratase